MIFSFLRIFYNIKATSRNRLLKNMDSKVNSGHPNVNDALSINNTRENFERISSSAKKFRRNKHEHFNEIILASLY